MTHRPKYPEKPNQPEVSSMQVSTTQLVELDLDGSATTKDAAVDRLVAVAAAAGRASDPAVLRADVAAREELLPTGIEGGIGIPHARSTGIDEPTVVFGRSTNGIDWGAADGPAHLVFLIAVPEGAGDSLLSGFLHAGGAGPDALRMGIAWATAAVQTPGTGVPSAGLIDPTAVEVSAIATASH